MKAVADRLARVLVGVVLGVAKGAAAALAVDGVIARRRERRSRDAYPGLLKVRFPGERRDR